LACISVSSPRRAASTNPCATAPFVFPGRMRYRIPHHIAGRKFAYLNACPLRSTLQMADLLRVKLIRPWGIMNEAVSVGTRRREYCIYITLSLRPVCCLPLSPPSLNTKADVSEAMSTATHCSIFVDLESRM
jgi:hypothetical protein